ncbi:4-hydroxythreonine-4-phosphate dehydrogenase PdxA [Caenimonas aquaedulcis]|uniref:4-hydroxythreonine-4-phosphate dehydrogenase PdxA n=1 Tax=Caenimonas aquaedulcis TaxID=2793270 RepID=A0A931H4A8_9BURK|nr:4-hydroxythreonine-4-phosphate dehydrogenase PdxA [Caenimonas aquaedulcis]MBG9388360.1 4-hydroxythreonine-4-phosphate dehydrogenase PdxA [Caenimonas aquaedulcis]
MNEAASNAKRPRLAVLLGDPAGVGPEMGVKLLAHAANLRAADILLIADDASLADGEWLAGVSLPVLRIEAIEDLRFEPDRISYLVQKGEGTIERAQSTAAAGRVALRALSAATDAARSGAVDGIVFAPLNKHALRMAGMTHEDELRFMQERFGVRDFVCEFNITGDLWTSRVTSHVPIRDVAALITEETIGEAVRIIDGALKRAGIERPRIAVSGLNPHAGDGGSIGMEEIEIIAPAVRRLKEEGLEATGPWSPDTVFIAARRGDFDAVVAMYHDQGQIAMKLMGFERGVTLHGGLPVPVATSASGSAFDIAGRGVARVEGLQHAFDLCARMAARAG